MSMNSNRFRHALLGASAMVSAAAVASVAYAADTRAYDFDMPAQPLTLALKTFGATADQQLIFSETLVKDRTAPALKGSYTPDQALAMLLSGSGLTADKTPGGVVTIRSAADPQSGSAAGGADGTVQALIVTAQKREEDIQDVPIAISAFTQEDLTRSQVAGGPDLITQVPNMTFTKTNFSSYSVQLRGIGTQAISATTDPAVAVAFNNTPFIRNRFFEQEFYDLERVEVLRGPQGTLYGRNATAGVVNIISAKPKFRFEAKLSADVGNYSSSRLEGMLNIPLVEDKVALRIAGAWTKRDGYATNELTGNPIDGRDLWSSRVSLRVSPNDRLNANLIWEHFEENDDRLRSGKQLCKKDIVTDVMAGGLGPNGVGVDVTNIPYYSVLPNAGFWNIWSGVQSSLSQGCERDSLYSHDMFQTPNGLMLPYYAPLGAVGLPVALDDPYASKTQSPDLRKIEATIDPNYNAGADIGELQISFDLTDKLTLTSETAYGTDFVYSLQDFNRFNTAPGAWSTAGSDGAGALARGVLSPEGVFCDPQLGCSDRLVAVDISTAKARQFSQEFRLASNYAGPFNFSLGANFLRADSNDKYYVFFNSLSLIAANGYAQRDILQPYQPGVSDNIECMANGYLQGDPNRGYGVTSCIYMDPNPIGNVNDEGHNYFLSKNPYKLISYAVFGEAYYKITENLKVTAGLRWTVDKKEAPRIPSWVLVSQSVGYPVAEVIEQEWREPTGRLAIDWKPDLSFTDETLLYASFAHGYKAGGANPPGFAKAFYGDPIENATVTSNAGSATRPLTFDPEFVNAFELGSKNTLLDGRLTLNLAGFYYDYTGYQISEIVDRSAYNRNVDATIWGLELESDWRPVENLRLGVKVGYEETSIAKGEQAIDLMDRTAGDPNWVVVRPFPTYASSCILPSWMFAHEGPVFTGADIVPNLYGLGGIGGGNPGGCELAYGLNRDPVTAQPYVANPQPNGYPASLLGFWDPGTYPGWDPSTAPNHGEGIMKNLGGNELPNAPNLTATITADYSIPLPNDWLATLHTDLHWQGQSDWRIFQDSDYSKLDEYFTMNLAAIFINEEQGWNIMAYIKNVTDETAITGAFLNSDDTGLTTNVFLTEPRLYGLRVTKTWSGGSTWGPFGERREGPFPLTVELGGQIQRHDAPTVAIEPGSASEFTGPLAIFDDAQATDLDWGDGREVRVIWRPSPTWSLAFGARSNETNGRQKQSAIHLTDPVCAVDDPATCEYLASQPSPVGDLAAFSRADHADAFVYDHEKNEQQDLMVGRDIAFGGLRAATIGLGLLHADFESSTQGELRGVPDWDIPANFFFGDPVTHTTYDIHTNAQRQFEGFGPKVEFDAALPLMESNDWGHVDLDFSLSGGALFGSQTVDITGKQKSVAVAVTGIQLAYPDLVSPPVPDFVPFADFPEIRRSDRVTAPYAGASLGVGYEVGRFRVGTGYRWERYFNVLDVGYEEAKDGDRTIDGPYFKIAVGFGG